MPLGTPINLVISLGKVDNVASGKNVGSDSEESSKGNTADKGNDGKTSTRWCANNGDSNHWWQVDLGSYYDLVGSEIMWEFDGSLYQYRIAVSSDNVQWKIAVNKSNNTLTSQIQQDLFTANNIRYVKITITGLQSGNWASFWEFKVFTASLTGIEPNINEGIIPKEFKLYQNFPNPFNPKTRIDYQVPQTAKVNISVYNILGQLVADLVNGVKSPGHYSVDWNAKDINGLKVSSGIYIARMVSNNYSAARKLILLK